MTLQRRQALRLTAATAVLLVLPHVALAQARRVPRVGFLSSSVQTYQQAFRDGMRSLGHIDGQNVTIEYRFAEGNDQLLPELAKQLVEIGVDMIVVTNSATTRAAMQATRSIPIIMVTSGDPIGSGFIESFARPGGNVTGLSSFVSDLSTKQLELLKELKPDLTRVAVLANLINDSNVSFLRQVDAHSKSLGISLQSFDIRNMEDLRLAFESISGGRFDGMLVLIDQFTISRRAQVVKFANESRLPTVYPLREFVLAGGAISYGCSFADLHRRAATYVDKLIKGARPSELPVELPTRFEVVINSKTLKSLGVEVPETILVRVDEEIE